MRAAFLQFEPRYLEVESNWAQVDRHLQGADADLIVLPELFTSGYFFQSRSDLRRVAERVPEGPTTKRLVEWARGTGATIVAGIAEQDGKDRFFNSAVVVDPDGYRGTYRKVHLYYEENTLFDPGDSGFHVWEVSTRLGTSYRLGVMICYDWYYPEAARSLALQGADVIAHPSNLVLPYCPESMPVRARENHLFTITANRYGKETKEGETLTFIGMSEICDPSGEIRLRADRTGDQLGSVDIDPHAARDRQLNAHNELFADRRPEFYTAA